MRTFEELNELSNKDREKVMWLMKKSAKLEKKFLNETDRAEKSVLYNQLKETEAVRWTIINRYR